jgi:hypothetical protein
MQRGEVIILWVGGLFFALSKLEASLVLLVHSHDNRVEG